MKKTALFIVVVLALVLAACGSKAANTVESPAAMPVPDMSMAESQDAYGGAAARAAGETGTTKPANSTTATQERMVITTVDMSIVVADPQTKMDAISKMAADLGGFVVSMNVSEVYTQSGETAPQGSISIRVPAEKLDDALNQIKANTVDVPSENHDSQDVTANYVDLQSQLTNLERAEQDLLAIMDEAKNNPGNDSTTKTQDVLNVYNQIVSVRGQIEQIKGQMQYYQQSSDLSLISVSVVAEKTIKPIEIGGWKPKGVARDAVQALVKFLQGFVNFVIYLVLLIVPILIVVFGPLALIAWGIIALVNRRKAKKAKGQ